jgi:hypothetical protein
MISGRRVGHEVYAWLEVHGAGVALALGLIVAAWFMVKN